MTELVPGIHRLPLPMTDNPLGFINAYLIRGEDGCLLVDTGWKSDEALVSLESQLGEIGLGFRDISRMVITHLHPDHYGLAGDIKKRSGGASIIMHPLERDQIAGYVDATKYLHPLRDWLRLNGMPEGEMPQDPASPEEQVDLITPVMPDECLSGGETITVGPFRFEVLWTPGHSPGHLCLYEPARKILFSGDFILPGITPNISLNPGESSMNPLDDYTDSLARIKNLDVSLILPAHQNLFTNLGRRIEELVQHHDDRKAEVVRILKDEDEDEKTGYQIATRMTWATDVGGADWKNMGLWDRVMALLEALAHVESMRVAGRLIRRQNGSAAYYRLAG